MYSRNRRSIMTDNQMKGKYMEHKEQTGQQQQQPVQVGESRMIEITMNDGSLKLVPWNHIQDVDVKFSSGNKVNPTSNSPDEKLTPNECFISQIGGKSFSLTGQYAIAFLGDLQSLGYYRPNRIRLTQQADTLAHSGR